jgi:hypothetical protein
MEREHTPITDPDKGQDICIKMIERVHARDVGFRES